MVNIKKVCGIVRQRQWHPILPDGHPCGEHDNSNSVLHNRPDPYFTWCLDLAFWAMGIFIAADVCTDDVEQVSPNCCSNTSSTQNAFVSTFFWCL
jgi:hypothetical protein